MTNVTIDKKTLEHLIRAAENWAEELEWTIIPNEEGNADPIDWPDEVAGYQRDIERTSEAAHAARRILDNDNHTH